MTDVEPDITGYVLEITSADTNNVLEISLQSTEYMFQSDALETCTVHRIRVVAENVLGRGNYSTIMEATIHRGTNIT